jgi:hypothetical protein
MKFTLDLTYEDLCHITASLNNQSINYRDWAFDNTKHKEVFDDYIESSRECKELEHLFVSLLKEAELKVE